MRLILTRHGETIENQKGIIQGHLPGKLSKLGIQQAKRLAKKLKEEKIDAIYSSDLARAADTSKEIIKFHKKTPVKFVKDLREKNHGEFQGLIGEKIPDSERKRWNNPKGGETYNEFYKRVMDFLDKTLHKHPNDTVLFVSHGGPIQILLGIITKKSKIKNPSNTSITILEIDEDKNHKIILYNCTKHLA